MIFIFDIFVLFIFGLLLGSFLNAWIWRAHEGLHIHKGRSMCPHCRTMIKWYDLFPIVSFFILKGVCRQCHKKISWQYPAVELWMGIVFVFLSLFYGAETWLIARSAVSIFFLTFIFVYDLQYGEVLDQASILPALFLFFISWYVNWQSWYTMLIGAIVASGFFLLQYIISRGKWIGGGDVRLGVLLGVIVGWPVILLALMLAYIIGACFSIAFVVSGRKSFSSKVPFGQYLTLATLVMMFWGQQFVVWYISFLK